MGKHSIYPPVTLVIIGYLPCDSLLRYLLGGKDYPCDGHITESGGIYSVILQYPDRFRISLSDVGIAVTERYFQLAAAHTVNGSYKVVAPLKDTQSRKSQGYFSAKQLRKGAAHNSYRPFSRLAVINKWAFFLS